MTDFDFNEVKDKAVKENEAREKAKTDDDRKEEKERRKRLGAKAKSKNENKEQENEPEPEIQKMSMEEWRISIKKEYSNLRKAVRENLPQLWLSVEFILAVKSIMNIQGVILAL